MEMVNSSKRLKNTTHAETKDLISELPDHILVRILSFLPILDAVKTVLLRRFGNLWRSAPILDLNGCMYHKCLDVDGSEIYDIDAYDAHNLKFGNIIHHVSNLHDVGVLDKLSLKYYFCFYYSLKKSEIDGVERIHKSSAEGHIDELVGYAINRKVKVLDLNFRGCSLYVDHEELYEFPDVFRSSYLTDMRLTACDIKSLCGEITLKALRVLFLDQVMLSDEIMENILLGCPILEDLSLVHCYGLRKLYCKNRNLNKLMLSLDPDREMHVFCPHVMSLKIADWIVGATLLDVSSPTDASISFQSLFKLKQRVYDGVQSLLQKISMCKTLTLCQNTILMLTEWNFGNMPCASYQWKNLIVRLHLTKWHHPGLSWLLKSCRSLETLTVYADHEDAGLLSGVASKFISHEFDCESYWDSQEATFPSLECITIHGYINEPYVDLMLKFLLRSATKLQKMVISMKEIFEAKKCDVGREKDEYCSSCQVLKLVQELSAFPKASSQAMIYVSC